VAALQAAGRFGDAVRLAAGRDARVPALATALDRGFGTRIAAAQQRFVRSARAATSALGGLGVTIAVLLLLAAVLAVAGLLQRIGEYR
jgi:hypothetical protein